jgi:hypothetical protein
MYREQVIWIPPRATAFTAVCDQCLDAKRNSAEGYLSAGVSGSLRLDAPHGWCRCPSGHEIRVERAHRALAGVIR